MEVNELLDVADGFEFSLQGSGRFAAKADGVGEEVGNDAFGRVRAVRLVCRRHAEHCAQVRFRRVVDIGPCGEDITGNFQDEPFMWLNFVPGLASFVRSLRRALAVRGPQVVRTGVAWWFWCS